MCNILFCSKISFYGGLQLGLKEESLRVQSFGKSIIYNADNQNHIISPTNSVERSLKNFTTTKIKLGFIFYEYFYMENELLNYQYFPDEGIVNFKPFQIKYSSDFFVKYKFMKLGYKHSCTHPVTAQLIDDIRNVVKFGSGFNHFYIDFSFKGDVL